MVNPQSLSYEGIALNIIAAKGLATDFDFMKIQYSSTSTSFEIKGTGDIISYMGRIS